MKLTSSALAAALAVAIAAPALAQITASETNSPPDIVLRCKQKTQDGKDVPSAGPPETVMIWSKAGVMSWPRGGRDSRFPAKVQPGTIFYDEPLNDGHRAGQIDRYTSAYEEMTYVGDQKTGTLGRGQCVVFTKKRQF